MSCLLPKISVLNIKKRFCLALLEFTFFLKHLLTQNYSVYFFFTALDLCCVAQAFSSCGEWKLLLVVVRRLLIGWLLLLRSTNSRANGLQYLQHTGSVTGELGSTGSVVVTHGPSCSMACGIFLDQELNCVPYIGNQICIHCATREVLEFVYYKVFVGYFFVFHLTMIYFFRTTHRCTLRTKQNLDKT